MKKQLKESEKSPAKVATSNDRAVGVPPKSSAKFSSDAYRLYRQELLMWLDANSKLSSASLKYLLIASFDVDTKKHVLNTLGPMFGTGEQEFAQSDLFECMDKHYSFSSLVENRRVVQECLSMRQGHNSLFQFTQTIRNNITRLKTINYSPPSDFSEQILLVI